MRYNFVVDGFHTKKLCSRLSSSVHLGLIGKSVVDFLLVLTELFSLSVTTDSLRVILDRKSEISL